VRRLGLLAAVCALAGCGGGSDPHRYPQKTVESFVKACQAQAGASTAICRCSIDRIEKRFTYDQFKRIDADASKGRPVPAPMTAIARGCAKEHRG
jgi:hypothetical protein